MLKHGLGRHYTRTATAHGRITPFPSPTKKRVNSICLGAMITLSEVRRFHLHPLTNRHLDLGCGDNPRNPLSLKYLFGCDLRDLENPDNILAGFIRSDLSKAKIEADDNHFDAVSAFDFIEHISRQEKTQVGETTFPFVNLMNEVFRVLVPNGIFLASTPAYPSPAAFQDPTHVNFISKDTHKYFCGDNPYAIRYGFKGCFECLFSGFNATKNLEKINETEFRQRLRNFNHKHFRGGLSHITWVFRAVKHD